MHEVALKGLQFKAYHGYYEEEKERGNHFSVDISVTTNFEEAAREDDLTKAVDYELLYSIIKEEMQIASSLLENVVYRISHRVLKEMASVESVKVSLSKLNPPIKGKCEKAVVSMQLSRV